MIDHKHPQTVRDRDERILELTEIEQRLRQAIEYERDVLRDRKPHPGSPEADAIVRINDALTWKP